MAIQLILQTGVDIVNIAGYSYVDYGNIQEELMGSAARIVESQHPRQAVPLDALWQTSPPLVATGLLMTVAAAASLAMMALDPRVITGAPAWLKPFKFAVSTAIYSLTLAWIFTYLADWARVR